MERLSGAPCILFPVHDAHVRAPNYSVVTDNAAKMARHDPRWSLLSPVRVCATPWNSCTYRHVIADTSAVLFRASRKTVKTGSNERSIRSSKWCCLRTDWRQAQCRVSAGSNEGETSRVYYTAPIVFPWRTLREEMRPGSIESASREIHPKAGSRNRATGVCFTQKSEKTSLSLSSAGRGLRSQARSACISRRPTYRP